MINRKLIRGSGGGPSEDSPRTPVESRDSLRSRSTAKLVDLISEGEIEGIVGGSKGIYLDETPLQNADGTYNFTGVEVTTREGDQAQTYIPGFGTVENEFFINVKIVKDVPIVRSIVNPAVDSVKIRISVPQLTSQNLENGDTNGYSVQYKIELQSNGGGFVTKLEQTITGKTTSKYQRSHLIDLTGASPWDIRVTRVTADDAAINQQSGIYLEALTQIVNAKLRYPNSAIVAMKFDSSQFGNVPGRAYNTRGLKIKIPDNATVNTIDGSLTYSGSWGGDFQIAWTTNPAWVLYDLLTTPRYGLGSYISEDQIDKWGLYTIGRYCDERVSDGFAGTEPRFSCGCLYLQEQAEAFTAIQNITSIFRGMNYWAAGAISTTQDSPSDPLTQFTQANVVEGRFTYMGSSAKARHSVALVTYNDPEDFYRQKVEYVEDAEAIRRIGYVTTQVYAVGCTSRSQAHRLGKWIIYTEQYETETVSFKLGLDGSLVRPGQVFYVADKMRAAKRRGGRIYSATTSQVIIDAELEDDLTGGLIACLLPDGSLETKTITGVTGRTISVTPNFTLAPQVHSVWSVSSAELEPQTFRAITIVEGDKGIFEITGLAYNASKFDAVENGVQLQERNITTLSSQPSPPENLQVEESLYSVAGIVKSKAVFSWDRVNNATEYQVSYRRDQGNFTPMPTVFNNEIEIFDTSPGNYVFSVVAKSSLGRKSLTSSLEKELYGKTSPPQDMVEFSLFPNGNAAFLTWKQSVDLDVIVGGSVRIRHTPRTTGQTWGSSIDVIDFVPGSDTFATAPLLAGTYLGKFVDSLGNESVTEAIALTTVPLPVGLNVVENVIETDLFLGTHNGTQYIPGLGLTLSTDVLFDDLGLIDSLSLIDFQGNVLAEGTYYFLNQIDLGQVFTSNLTANIKTLAFDTGIYFDDITDLIDDWIDIDGSALASVNAKLYVRTTEDDPAGVSPIWTQWKNFLTGSYKARGYEFKIVLTSGNVSQNIAIQELDVTIDMPDRVEDHRSNVSGVVNPFHLTFDYEFNVVPSLGFNMHDMVSGDYYAVSNKTTIGFDIVFKNASNVVVSRTFDVLVKGYGLKE